VDGERHHIVESRLVQELGGEVDGDGGTEEGDEQAEESTYHRAILPQPVQQGYCQPDIHGGGSMASRSDQLHSHQFSRQRAIAALTMRDPDPAAPPQRRINGALFASVMVALLAVAGAGVYGLLRPGTSGAWRDGQA